MSVYVDYHFSKYGRMIMCHMIADTLEELHQMADKIGVKRKWFQGQDPRRPHYDICMSKRSLAVLHGAIEITSKDVVKILRKRYPLSPHFLGQK